jgi:nitrite reductase (NO-forming)
MIDPQVNKSADVASTKASRIDRRAFLGLGAGALVTAGGIAVVVQTGMAQDSTPSADGTPGASPEASPAASPVAGAGPTVATVDIAFEPKEFTIAADTDVVVAIENKGALQHDFVIDELGVKSELLDGGASTTVTINAPAGTYEFYCSVPGHKQAGMVGSLTVE